MRTIEVFSEDNSEGYSAAERQALNKEFTERWCQIAWQGATLDEAKKWFVDEVARR